MNTKILTLMLALSLTPLVLAQDAMEADPCDDSADAMGKDDTPDAMAPDAMHDDAMDNETDAMDRMEKNDTAGDAMMDDGSDAMMDDKMGDGMEDCVEDEESPGIGLLLLVVALAAIVWVRRR